ncbi:MMPL family transporter [Actinoplanes subtropicus]|uniref:MMPL family transporter n=1 Tax=Actinoplanes subtropicus TaxID=543632 RepID=UPI0004C3B9D4|nr:MMPL family transporter [Actinoplanes subtropicus]
MAAIARWCFRHRYIVVLFWVAALVGLGVANQAVGTAYNNSFALPGTESTRALDLLKTAFPQQAGDSDTIVWHVSSGSVRDPAVQQPVTAMLDQVSHAASVAGVTSPYSQQGAAQVSRDGRTAYATVTFTGIGNEVPPTDVKHVISLAQGVRQANLQVELGGQAIQASNGVSTSASEFIGIVGAAIILLIAFGSVLAMLLPIVTAILSLIAAVMSIGLLSHALTIADIAPTIAALIGLGVGIDYALFVVTRHRSGLKAGLTPEESTVRALNTSGRAVLFAGATVCVAMLGMLVLNLSFLNGVGIAAAVMVVFSVIAASTLLPALLGILGPRVLSRRERRRLADEGPEDVYARGFWYRWAQLVQRRRMLLAPLALAVIAVLAIPVFSLRLGNSDQGNDPAGTTTRKAYDLLAEGFGPGFNGPLQLVATIGSPDDATALTQLAGTVAHTPGVASAFAVPVKPGGTVGIVQVVPTTAPQDAKTSDLIKTLRHDIIPAAEQGHTLKVYVGGQTAIFDDFADVISGKLPLFIGVIVGLGFLLLLVAFRSLVVPLTAAVMNLLAAGASFGVVVAFFQWGWGSDALGLGKAGPVEAFLPVMMLAILFGLSMDYQVFLVSRMHEEWVHTRDNRRAVTVGQAATGRVITAAATIMICVFLAFVFGGQRVIAEFGIGLSAAVFLDAFVLRTVLVPALMHLFGRANWWLPGWLDRRLPHLSVEPADEDVRDEPAPEPAPIGA